MQFVGNSWEQGESDEWTLVLSRRKKVEKKGGNEKVPSDAFSQKN